jgi:hypothetical protein
VTAAPAPLSSTGPRLRLGRVRFATRLAMPAALTARQPRLDESDLVTHVKTELASLLTDGDRSLWIIRRLHVSAVADAAGGGAEAVARALREAVARALRGGAESIVRFESRAERLAAFVADLAAGDAFDRWYHARYCYLAPLPLAQAMRLALAAESNEALPAFVSLLEAGRLARVIDQVGAEGARSVLAVLAPPAIAAKQSVDPTALAEAAAMEPGFRRWNHGPQARLALVVIAARHLSVPPAATAAAAPAAFRLMAQRQSSAQPVGPGRGIIDAEGDSVTAVGRREAVGRTMTGTAKGRPLELATPLPTPFAGVFLLWRSVVELGLPALLTDGRMRLQLAATLAGPNRAAALDDPALHWLADHVPEPDEHMPRPPPTIVVARLLVERAAPRVPTLIRQNVGRLRIIQDAQSEDWLAAGSERHAHRLVVALGLGRPDPAPEEARPASVDLDHFGAAEGGPASGWAVLARAAHADLARRLPGLARSSGCWIARNLVAGQGELIMADGGVCVRLPRVALDLALRMTGIDRTSVDLGDGRSYRLMLPGSD